MSTQENTNVDESIAWLDRLHAAAQAEWDALTPDQQARRTAAAEAEEAMRLNRQAVTAAAQWGHIQWPADVEIDAIAREEIEPDLVISTCGQYAIARICAGALTDSLLIRGGVVDLGQVGHCGLYRIPSDRMAVVHEIQNMDQDQRLARCQELGIW